MDETEQKIQAIGSAYFHPFDADLEGYIEKDGIITAHFETTTRTIIDHEEFFFPAEYLALELSDKEIAHKCGAWDKARLHAEYLIESRKERYAQYLILKEEFE